MKLNILITGANGFVGRSIINHFSNKNYTIYGMVRNHFQNNIKNIKCLTYEDLLKSSSDNILSNIDAIIHTAGRAHIRFSFLKKNKNKLYYDNVQLTEQLATIAIKHKIKQFIFISSAKIYGEETKQNFVFNEKCTPNPQQAYSISKYNAELKLINKLRNSSTNYTIIRPPMIFGNIPNGNLKILIFAIKNNIPIPLSRKNNLRSFLGLENLCLFLGNILSNKNKKDLICNVSDGAPISTKKLIDTLGLVLNKKVRYLFVPDLALKITFKLPIISNLIKPLFKNFVIESIHNNKPIMNRLPNTTEKLILKSFIQKS